MVVILPAPRREDVLGDSSEDLTKSFSALVQRHEDHSDDSTKYPDDAYRDPRREAFSAKYRGREEQREGEDNDGDKHQDDR